VRGFFIGFDSLAFDFKQAQQQCKSRSSELEQGEAKMRFEAQLAVANEHSKRIFNAAMPTRSRSFSHPYSSMLPIAVVLKPPST
jgi:hypothetical protein